MRTFTAPISSRSRETVAWVATTPSAASSSTSWLWPLTACCSSSRAMRCWRWDLANSVCLHRILAGGAGDLADGGGQERHCFVDLLLGHEQGWGQAQRRIGDRVDHQTGGQGGRGHLLGDGCVQLGGNQQAQPPHAPHTRQGGQGVHQVATPCGGPSGDVF